MTKTPHYKISHSLPPRRGGFTLIELLVVIAIIALLAAILFPVFAQARERARITTGLSDAKQVMLGVLQYTQDNEETLPFAGNSQNITGGSVGVTEWPESCYSYIKNEAVYKDPNDKSVPDDHTSTAEASGSGAGFAAKYSATSFLMNGTETTPVTISGIQSRNAKVLAAFDAPSQYILLMEGQRHTDGTANTQLYGAGAVPDHNGNIISVWKADYANGTGGTVEGGALSLFGVDLTGTTTTTYEGPFHKTGEIFAFLDGHVKFVPLNMANPIADLRKRLPWCTYGHLPQNSPTCASDWNDGDT